MTARFSTSLARAEDKFWGAAVPVDAILARIEVPSPQQTTQRASLASDRHIRR